MPRTLGVIYTQALYTLQDGFEVNSLITVKMIYCCKVTLIPITQEVIDIVETLSKKDVIKSPLKSKDRKEGTIHEYDGENDDNNNSIAGLDDKDEG